MAEKPARDTRAAILAVARELFARHGYQRTSLREIAERLGVTKAAVLYHFPGKPDILAALAQPLLDDLDAAMAKAADAVDTRWPAIEGMLDTLLAHRQSLRMVMHDLALLSQNPVFHRFSAALTTANRLVAGPDPNLAGRVRAAQAIAMLGDPVFLLADTPIAPLRREILTGVRRLLGEPEPEPGPEPGREPEPGAGRGPDTEPDPAIGREAGPRASRRRTAGRPSVLDADRLATARRLHAAGTHSVEQIAAELGVSRATLYRRLSPR